MAFYTVKQTTGSQFLIDYARILIYMSTSNSDFDDKVFGASAEDLRALKTAYGKVLAHRRTQSGINRTDFARMVGISISHLREMEDGEGNPMLTTQHRIAAALGTDISEMAKSTLIEAFSSGE